MTNNTTKLSNGYEMPMEGLRTFLLTPAEAQASSEAALKDGYRLIDTANTYLNEKGVGRAIKESDWTVMRSLSRPNCGPVSMRMTHRLTRRLNILVWM